MSFDDELGDRFECANALIALCKVEDIHSYSLKIYYSTGNVYSTEIIWP